MYKQSIYNQESILNFIKDKLDFDQLIWEFGNDENPAWVHVSFSSKNRKQVLKATKKNGKTIYSNYSIPKAYFCRFIIH